MTTMSGQPRREPAAAGSARETQVTDDAKLRLHFANRVLASLDEIGLSKGELAERSALPLGHLERILAGSPVPLTFRDMTIIAAVLAKPVYALLLPTDLPADIVPIEVIETDGPDEP